ncbi:MAG: glycosyltransferase family 4 protein [bacterium]
MNYENDDGTSPSVTILPFMSGENPHLSQLKQSLEDRGVEVRTLDRAFFLPAFLSNSTQVIHLQWIHPLIMETGRPIKSIFKTVAYFLQVLLLKFLGVTLVWTLHNLHNHEKTYLWLDNLGSKFTARMADSVHVYCQRGKTLAREYYELDTTSSFEVIPYGNYVDYYPNTLSQDSARSDLSLGSSDMVYLFVGSIRAYKGIPRLVNAFKGLEVPDKRLVVAGSTKDDRSEEILNRASQAQESIIFRPGFVDVEAMNRFFNAADIVTLPFENILNSGSLILAMSYGKACIVPSIGCVPEHIAENGGFLYEPGNTEGLKSAMAQAFENRERLESMGERNYEKASEAFAWDRIGKQMEAFYHRA